MSGDNDPVADDPVADDLTERDDLADEADAADEADLLDTEETDDDEIEAAPDKGGARFSWGRLLVATLPALALILALGVGYLKWLDGSERASRLAAIRLSVGNSTVATATLNRPCGSMYTRNALSIARGASFETSVPNTELIS